MKNNKKKYISKVDLNKSIPKLNGFFQLDKELKLNLTFSDL